MLVQQDGDRLDEVERRVERQGVLAEIGEGVAPDALGATGKQVRGDGLLGGLVGEEAGQSMTPGVVDEAGIREVVLRLPQPG